LPGDLAADRGTVWVLDFAPTKRLQGRLLRISPAGQILDSIPVPPGGAAELVRAGDRVLWYASGTSIKIYGVGFRASVLVDHDISDLAVDRGGVWVTDPNADTVERIDAASRRVTETVRVGRTPVAVAVGGGSVWVANARDKTVTRIDPLTTDLTTIPVGGTPHRIAFGASGVWVTVTAP
jgi:YVTN family beta-propeller protein